jgi:threonine-phosphate decarboxylase
MIKGHGDDAYLYDKNIIANFSSNVYYDGFPAGMKNHLISAIDKINTYPEANADSLQQYLGQWHSLSTDQLLITNGATEAFYLIAHNFRNKSVTIVIPSFAEYEDACRANNLPLQFLDWDNLSNNTRFTTDVVFLGNPNNPTGAILRKDVLQSIIEINSQTTFVIDEAYVDFSSENISMVNELTQFTNLIIVKSLTKTYAIPGLRLGYILSNPAAINNISSRKMPWSVNAMAIEAGKYIVQNHIKSPLPLKQLLHDTEKLIQQLKEIEYIKVLSTKTNFFLCETNKGTASELKSFLLDECGLLIRDASNFKGLGTKHFRIATQTKEKNELLVKGIFKWTTSF